MTLALAEDQVLDLAADDDEPLPALSDLRHRVAAYLAGLAASSRRPQLAALEAIACAWARPGRAGPAPLLARNRILRQVDVYGKPEGPPPTDTR